MNVCMYVWHGVGSGKRDNVVVRWDQISCLVRYVDAEDPSSWTEVGRSRYYLTPYNKKQKNKNYLIDAGWPRGLAHT